MDIYGGETALTVFVYDEFETIILLLTYSLTTHAVALKNVPGSTCARVLISVLNAVVLTASIIVQTVVQSFEG